MRAYAAIAPPLEKTRHMAGGGRFSFLTRTTLLANHCWCWCTTSSLRLLVVVQQGAVLVQEYRSSYSGSTTST